MGVLSSGVLSSSSKLPLSQIQLNKGDENITKPKNKRKNNKISEEKPHDHHNHDHDHKHEHNDNPEHIHENKPENQEV